MPGRSLCWHVARAALPAALLLAAPPAQPAAVDFRAAVLPILEESCLQCHRGAWVDERGRTRKPKGGLRLDGAGWIRAGGDGGPVVVPGRPEESPLLRRVALPPDDDDRMPAKGDPLQPEQVERIRAWIAGGADFGGWTGEAGGSEVAAAAPPPAVELVERLGQGVQPARPATVAKAAGALARIAPAQPGSALLRVEFPTGRGAVTDRDVAALAPLRAHITHLDLARTAVTDRALEVVARMPLLTRLDLHGTAVTDGGLAHLGGLSELRYLNLHGTPVTDRGLGALERLANLEAVYLWGTRVTDAGAAALGQRLAGATVHHRRELPR